METFLFIFQSFLYLLAGFFTSVAYYFVISETLPERIWAPLSYLVFIIPVPFVILIIRRYKILKKNH